MAVELCSENCGVSVSPGSPRISFSHDFSQSDVIPVEQHPFRSNSSGLSSFDFDFPVSESLLLDESSSAEELFSDGRIRILPSTESTDHQVKRKNQPLKQTSSTQSPPPLPPPYCDSTNKSLKKESPKLIDEVCDKQSSSKSFWSFKRSSSCGSGYGRSLCPLPLLSRSNSTGSTPSVKKEGPNIKQNQQKHCSSSRISGPNSYHKPPLNKNHGSYYGNSVRVSPVINVPSANLFGLGSIFSNSSRDKSKKK
ncbi:uncharacterized protein LOC130728963 [Lotus japonicus]|uniref:uncharacterized protein LOC130728963 n=1 Tax=Lotus japonicus TaxID=34305 RepID=UPI00258B73A1|nr:uncharacterized protein LOC130728963 [Lotus japonicus]